MLLKYNRLHQFTYFQAIQRSKKLGPQIDCGVMWFICSVIKTVDI